MAVSTKNCRIQLHTIQIMMNEDDAPAAPEVPEEKAPEPVAFVSEDKATSDDSNDNEMTRPAFDKWLEDATNAKMSATVSEPTVIKSGTFGGVTYGYKVCCASLGSATGVWRRYSDFEWLYNVLAYRYSGTIIAPMPEKKIANTSKEFLEKRNRQLGAWLMLTLQNPYVKRDATMHEFLTSTQVDKEWDTLKKMATEEAKIPWVQRPNCKQWRYYLTHCLELSSDTSEVLDGLWASAATQLTVVQQCLSSLTTMDSKQKSLATAINNAGVKSESMGFATSPAAVINEVKDLAGERKQSMGNEDEAGMADVGYGMKLSFVDAEIDVTGKEMESLSTSCNELARTFTAMAAGLVGGQSAAASRSVFWRLCVVGLMQHWKSHLEEVQSVNKKLISMVGGLTKAEMAVKKNITKLEGLKEKHGLQEDVVLNCENELEKQKNLVLSFTAEYECARKAMYHDEGEKFVQSRTRSLKRLMSQLCVLSSATHSHSAKQWASVSASAKKSLEAFEGAK